MYNNRTYVTAVRISVALETLLLNAKGSAGVTRIKDASEASYSSGGGGWSCLRRNKRNKT